MQRRSAVNKKASANERDLRGAMADVFAWHISLGIVQIPAYFIGEPAGDEILVPKREVLGLDSVARLKDQDGSRGIFLQQALRNGGRHDARTDNESIDRHFFSTGVRYGTG